MPILHNSQKALRSSRRKAEVNRRIKSKAKTAIDQLKAEPSADRLSQAFSALDRAMKHNLFHGNKVARLKSQLSRLVK